MLDPTDPVHWHNRLSPILEKLETVLSLQLCIEKDEQMALTLSILFDIASDYAGMLRRALTTLVEEAHP
jgi:hypothetical protein